MVPVLTTVDPFDLLLPSFCSHGGSQGRFHSPTRVLGGSSVDGVDAVRAHPSAIGARPSTSRRGAYWGARARPLPRNGLYRSPSAPSASPNSPSNARSSSSIARESTLSEKRRMRIAA